MKITQVYELVNAAGGEVLGKTGILAEDLSNVVDFGRQIMDAEHGLDNYVKALINRVGRTVFVSRVYKGKYASLQMEKWEYGSILMKISGAISDAKENESWDLHDGQSYDPHVVRLPEVDALLFNSKVTFEIAKTFPMMQAKESFNGADEMVAFVATLETWIENSLTIKTESLSRGLVNTGIAATLLDDFGEDDFDSGSHVKAVNLLYLYNQDHPDATLTATECIKSPEFIRFAAYVMGTYLDRLASMSTLFNIKGRERFTPADRLRVILLSDFERAAQVYLYGDTYHEAMVKLPEATDIIPFWQGSGTGYAYGDVSKIHVNIDAGDGTTEEVTATGILGVMMDKDAMAICNTDRRTYVDFDSNIEAYQHRYKYDASYFADKRENFVVFFAA